MSRIFTVTLNPALDLSTETESVRPDLKLRCDAPRFDPGGGGVNVSRAIAILGGESHLLLALGGAVGEELRWLLDRAGLEAIDLGIGHPTRQSVAVLERASGRQYRFVMPGTRWSREDCATAARHISEEMQEGDTLVSSGSLPPGVPPDFFPSLNAALLPRGVRMILDTSGQALEAAAAARGAPLFALRMDREEAEALAGKPLAGLTTLADMAAGLVKQQAAGIVAISSGAEGTIVATEAGRWLCPAPKVQVISKVGAGDSFVAGFTLALVSGETAARACAAGVAAATSAVTTPDTMLCEREAVAHYLREIEAVPF